VLKKIESRSSICRQIWQ